MLNLTDYIAGVEIFSQTSFSLWRTTSCVMASRDCQGRCEVLGLKWLAWPPRYNSFSQEPTGNGLELPLSPGWGIGLDVGFGDGALRRKPQQYWDGSSSQVSLWSCFHSTPQVGEKPKRGSTSWAKVSLKFNFLDCLYLLQQLPWVCSSLWGPNKFHWFLKVVNF